MMTHVRYILVFILAWAIHVTPSLLHADELADIAAGITSSPDLVAKGKTIFTVNCASCHGNEGKGDGPAAAAFNPKPRNFSTEKFKNGSSPSAIFHTLANGLGSMPSFSSMPLADRLAVVHYVVSISANKESDTPESLAKIGLGPDKKPLAGFQSTKLPELPVEFIIERMAKDGDIASIDYQALAKKQEEARPKPPVPLVADLERGKVLYNACSTCHGDKGGGDQIVFAPQIAGQSVSYLTNQLKKFQSGARGAHPDDVNGLKMRPMARTLRTEQDVVDVVGYVSSLTPSKPVKTLQGNAEKGKIAFATCIACHGADGKGMEAMNAPSLLNLQDWYVLNQIKSFKAGIRGADPRDTTGAQMRGMAMVLADDQAVADVMAYIESLSAPKQ